MMVLLVAPQTAQSQSSSLPAARIHASVEMNSAGQFVYRYAVENGERSAAGIGTLAIDVASAPGVPLVRDPIRLFAPQSGWRARVSADARAQWDAIKETDAVQPKNTVGGFSLVSQRPPAIRRFILTPRIDPDR